MKKALLRLCEEPTRKHLELHKNRSEEITHSSRRGPLPITYNPDWSRFNWVLRGTEKAATLTPSLSPSLWFSAQPLSFLAWDPSVGHCQLRGRAEQEQRFLALGKHFHSTCYEVVVHFPAKPKNPSRVFLTNGCSLLDSTFSATRNTLLQMWQLILWDSSVSITG